MDISEYGEILGESVAIKMVEPRPAPLLVNRTPSSHGAATCPGGVYRIKQESPRQRLALELAASGKTNKEISEITGYAPATVGAILRQPILQQTLVDEIRRTVDNIDAEVLEIVKEGCLESAKRLLRIVKDDKAKGSDHIAAANTFLERRYGKANQPINAKSSIDLNNLSDAELARQLADTAGTGTSGVKPTGNTPDGTETGVSQ